MTRPRNVTLTCVMIALAVAVLGGASCAQQATSTDIWRIAPSNSLLIVGFDGRPDNASMQAIAKVRSPENRDALAKQQAMLRKSMEDFALLFGISLDFAKDIESWADQQWAFVLVPDAKKSASPVFVVASKDAAAANAALQKMLAPWQRIGKVTQEADTDFPITSFKMEHQLEVYASASGPLVAVSPSKDGLKQFLQGKGFAAGSAGDKATKALSGSMLYAYVDPGMLKVFHADVGEFPLTGFGLGVSAVETGVKVRVLGLPSEQGAVMLKQMLPAQQATVLTANPGMPSTSLVEASFPNLSSFSAMAGMFGMTKDPMFAAFQEISDTQISGALTAALPTPAGFVSGMAASDQAAADKLAKIIGILKDSKMSIKDGMSISGLKATEIGSRMYLAQVGSHIVLASDAQSLSAAASTIKGEQPGLAQSATYKETMAGLDNSNLLTAYVNLAPVEGIGFLADGLGIGSWPLYGSIAKCLENMQALGLGVGFDGETASATLFLRARPEMGPTIGPAVIAGTAVGAAILFPVFARAREAARESECMNNLKQLAIAAQLYAADHNNKLPSSAGWQSQLEKYLHRPLSELECHGGESVYAFNKNLSGVNLNKIRNPENIVLFFEAEPELPYHSGSRADAIFPHHGKSFFAYVDTHVRREYELPSQSYWIVQATPKPVKKAPVKKAPARVKYRR